MKATPAQIRKSCMNVSKTAMIKMREYEKWQKKRKIYSKIQDKYPKPTKANLKKIARARTMQDKQGAIADKAYNEFDRAYAHMKHLVE